MNNSVTTREDILKKILNNDDILSGKFNKKVRVGRYLPDFIWQTTKYTIIIECDEWNHTDKHFYDEFIRMLKIQNIINTPVIFFRLASDCITNFHYTKFGGGGRSKNIRFIYRKNIFISRINRLIKIIKSILNIPENKYIKNNNIIIYYLYYSMNTPVVKYNIKTHLTKFMLEIKKKLKNGTITTSDKFTDINQKCNIKMEIIQEILIDLMYL